MSAVVVDTGVFSAPLLTRRKVGQTLEEKYRRHLIGHQLVIATQTLGLGEGGGGGGTGEGGSGHG